MVSLERRLRPTTQLEEHSVTLVSRATGKHCCARRQFLELFFGLVLLALRGIEVPVGRTTGTEPTPDDIQLERRVLLSRVGRLNRSDHVVLQLRARPVINHAAATF